MTYESREPDENKLKRWKRRVKKYPEFRLFLATKSGSNARGDGANRSVILGSSDGGKTWKQFEKFWGSNDVERAKKFLQDLADYRKAL